ncbi:hypothetical protein [Enterococcus sp. AZ163]|uniref:hypothetical protein n=1 Tax=Enterococcus sp. AZ163 TaxID=2774638 RepID=UPI003D2AB6E6
MKKNTGKIVAGVILIGLCFALGSVFIILAGLAAFIGAVGAMILFLIKKDNRKAKKAIVTAAVAFAVTIAGFAMLPASENSATKEQIAAVDKSTKETSDSSTSESTSQTTKESKKTTASSSKAKLEAEKQAEAKRKEEQKKIAEEQRKAEEAQKIEEQQKAEAERVALEQQQAREAAQKAEQERIAQEAAAAQQQAALAAQQQAEAEAQQAAAQAQAQPQVQTVFIAPQSGTKYHSNSGCRGLSNANSVEEVSLDSVGNLTPCKICY